MIRRRMMLSGAVGLATLKLSRAFAETPGVTPTEIKIGNTMPYSGPASPYSVVGTLEQAFFRMINDNGGIAGRRIAFISYDDGYSPPRALEQVRRLIEVDQVDFLFSTLGTPTNSAFVQYVNAKQVPHLFLATGADKWGDYKQYPWTMGFQPSNRTEAQIYAIYILAKAPNPRVAILHQNDDFGKDYVAGVTDVFAERAGKLLVRTASYEPEDPTIDSQIVTLRASGANVLINAAGARQAAQAIRKMGGLGWKPELHFLNQNASSIGAVITPAGPENSVGVISADFLKDPLDPAFKGDPGIQEWREFMAKYMPRADTTDGNYVFAYALCKTLTQVLTQCEGNYSRENVLRQAENLRGLPLPILRPGITLNTSHTTHRPVRSMQLTRFDGTSWVTFGQVIQASDV